MFGNGSSEGRDGATSHVALCEVYVGLQSSLIDHVPLMVSSGHTIHNNTIDIQVLPSGLFRTRLQIYTVEVGYLRVLESPLERLTC